MVALLASGNAAASQPLPFNQAAVKQSTAPASLGPSASTPYFTVRFAMPIPPDNDKLRSGSLVGIDAAVADHHHSPGFEVMPNGDVMIVSFSGPSGREGGPHLRIVQARLRHGAEEFDMPEEITVEGLRMQDLRTADGKRVGVAGPLLWREGSTVWLFVGGHQWQPPGEFPRRGGFRVFKSMDNGATWEIVALEPTFSALSGGAHVITNAFRAPNGDMFVADDGPDGEGTSLLWRSSDNGLSWTDQGGRTDGRHSTIVPLNTSGSLLSLGGKDTNLDNNGVVFKDVSKNRYMPQNISTNWGVTWGAATQSPFPWLGGNQRPSMIRLASGNLVMVGDSCHIHQPTSPPPGWAHGNGPYVALSTNNGSSWTIKALPVGLKHEHRIHRTIGYSTVRQAPNGVIHILATMTHPCLHYELNEAWITSTAGDIAPETTGGTVQSYSETHPGGAPKATWSARRTTGGRYLLDGVESHFYADGTKQREVTWVSGRRTGPETLWGPDGTRIWSWNHDLANNVSTWTHWWSNGQKRLESQWDTNPAARDLPTRRFRGLVAHGTARHWNTSGQQVGQFAFLNGDRIFPLGNHRETFATDPGGRGWTGSNNTTDGNDFKWSSSTSWCQNNNAGYMTDKGEIGGVFARSSTYRWFADTNVGTRNRTQTLRMSGVMRLDNVNFDGAFRIGYFNTSGPANNFIGLEIREPAGTILDPTDHGSGTKFRAYLTVNGAGGTSSPLPFELDFGSGNSGRAFDLIWTGNSDGSGTLSGSVQSVPLPSITVGAGSSSFNAFGLLNGGMSSNNATEVTGPCWFDDLNYDKGAVTTYNVAYNTNGATGGAVPSPQTKPHGVNLPVSTNSGDLVRSGYTFAGWNTNTGGTGTNYAPGTLYTANANTTLYARWTTSTPLLVHYTGDLAGSDFQDSSGRGNHGTAGGATQETSNATIGSTAMFIGGGNNSVDLSADHADFNRTYEAFTLSMWINPGAGDDTSGGSLTWFAGKMGGSGNRGWQIGRRNAGHDDFRKMHFGYSEDAVGTWGGLDSTSTVPVDQWTHFAVTFAGGQYARMYINGVLDSEVTNTVETPVRDRINGVNSAMFQVGNRGDNHSLSTFGRIDDFGLWDVAMTGEQIQQIYSQGNTQGRNLQEALGAITYTVTYDANGATSGTAPVDQTKTHDVPLTLATNSGNLARTGYNFAGWNTAANGTGTNYAEGASYTANEDVTLYARWTEVPPPGTGEVTETFDTAASTAANGWTGHNNTVNGQNFGWNSTSAVLGSGTGGAAGGIFARQILYSYYADTTLGGTHNTLNRTQTLKLSGYFNLRDSEPLADGTRFNSNLYLGFFDAPEARSIAERTHLASFIGLDIRGRPAISDNFFRGYIGIGTPGIEGQTYTATSTYVELALGVTQHFDLTWTPTGNGRGTLAGTLAGVAVSLTTEDTSIGNFNAFGIVTGNTGSVGATRISGPSFFDSLTYTTGDAGSGFAAWQAANNTTGGLADDHDKDGVPNGIEYFLGGPNGNSTGFTALPGVTHTGGTFSVTWTKSPDYPGTYGTDFRVETTETLATGSWTTETLGGNVTITGNDVTYTFPAGSKNFARLVVTGP